MWNFLQNMSHLFTRVVLRHDWRQIIFTDYPDLDRADAHPLQHPAHLPGHPGGLPGRGAGLLHQGVRPVHPLPLGDVPRVRRPPPGHAQRLLQLPHLLLRLLTLQDCPH